MYEEFLLVSLGNYYVKHLLDLCTQSGGRYAPPASKSIIALVTWLPGRGDPRQGSFPAGSREGGFPWPILQGHGKGASVEAHSGEPFPG